MVLRSRDSRRRRVMIEESVQSLPDLVAQPVAQGSTKSAAQSPTARRLYANGANRRHQLKSTDLIPKRVRSCVVVVFCLASVVCLLNYLALYSPFWHSIIGHEGAATLALTGSQTLAAWFCSAMFLLAAITSCQIYWLRKHRCDDYRGSYRVWSWLAIVLLVTSIGCVANIGGILYQVAKHYSEGALTSGGLPPFGAMVWVLLSAIAIRVMFEVNVSRSALSLVLVAWFAGSCLIATTLPAATALLAKQSCVSVDAGLLAGNARLIGAMAVLLATTTYARCIYLLAHGLIKPRVVKPKAVAKKKAERKPVAKKKAAADKKTEKPAVVKSSTSKSGSSKRSKPAAGKKTPATPATRKKQPVESESVTPPQTHSKPSTKPSKKAAAQPADEGCFDDIEPIISMSKAERRRKRKLEKRQRRAA